MKHTECLLSEYLQLITTRSGGKHLSGYEHHASLSLCLAMAKAGEAGVKLAARLLLKREKFAKFRKMLLARRVCRCLTKCG